MAAPSTLVKTSTMGTVTLTDGSGTPVTLTLSYDKGDLTIDGLGHRLNELVMVQARGRHVSEAYGERRYPTISFTAWCPNLVGSSTSTPGSMAEFLTGKGAYGSNTSTLGTNRPMAVHVTLNIEGSAFGDTADESIQCKSVHAVIGFTEGMDGNTLSIQGTVLGDIVVTNSANTVTYSQISTPTP